jgi:ATP-dependent helicase HrpA
MTDGVLLAEIAHDRLLSKYDTLIIDEAHERSLTIDFLLGYLRQLLPRRPDLRVVITSARSILRASRRTLRTPR